MRALLGIGVCLLAGCGAAPARGWRPAPDESAERAVVYVSTECSGVLVAPTVVLTAAHCMSDPGPWTVRVAATEIDVVSCAVHPEAYAEPRACGAGPGWTTESHDLAVLELAEPSSGPVAPVLLAPPTLRREWWRAQQVRLVGWDRRPLLTGPLERRSGPNRVISLRRGSFVTEPLDRQGFRTVIGDSGGAAFLRVDGTEHLLGVLWGGLAARQETSIFAATFDRSNARWLVSTLPSEWGRDLPTSAAAD